MGWPFTFTAAQFPPLTTPFEPMPMLSVVSGDPPAYENNQDQERKGPHRGWGQVFTASFGKSI